MTREAVGKEIAPMRRAGCAAGVALGLAAAAYGAVEVNVTRVGFPSLRGGSVVRNGLWTPVVADIALLNESSFDGTIRLAQRDTDGDRYYDAVEVHLRRESGGTQRAWLYAPASARRDANKFELQVFDASGQAVKVISQGEVAAAAAPSEQPTVISDDDWLVLSVSARPVGRIRELLDAHEGRDANTARGIAFRRDPHVAHIAPGDLPELWLGLEMVDAVLWEDARADDLNQRQREALLEWVRRGGRLMITSSRYAGSLAITPSLEVVLPVTIGEVVTAENLPDLRREFVTPPEEDAETPQRNAPERRIPWYDVKFAQPVPVVRCLTRPGCVRMAFDEAVFGDVAARRRVDRGEVIFLAVTTHDLFSAPGGAAGFFQRFFALAEADESERQARATGVSIFNQVAGAVSFATSGGLYLMLATLGSIAYAALATVGSWHFLTVRGWRRHSWTAFAVLAVLASACTVLAVNFQRGFGDSLHQLCVVDSDAGSSRGSGTCFFGVRTTTDKEVDLWLPPDPLAAAEPRASTCALRPIPGDHDPLAVGSSFVDPEEYRVVPASAVVEGVRIRATLKQFEGRWAGPLGGKLSGALHTRRGVIAEGSFVINDLGGDLEECLLLLPTVNLAAPFRPRSDLIQLFDLGDLPSDGQVVQLAPRCLRPEPQETLGQFLARSTLAEAHRQWRSAVPVIGMGMGVSPRSARGEERRALLLASTVGDLTPQSLAGLMDPILGLRTVSRDRLRGLDLREALEAGWATGEATEAQAGHAVLIGFARHGGPARLFRREGDRAYRMLKPDERRSLTMYRIHLPIRVLEGGSYRSPVTGDEEHVE